MNEKLDSINYSVSHIVDSDGRPDLDSFSQEKGSFLGQKIVIVLNVVAIAKALLNAVLDLILGIPQ